MFPYAATQPLVYFYSLLIYRYRSLESDGDLVCDDLIQAATPDNGRRSFRDIVDLVILDFLTYHFDSKLYKHENKQTPVYIDRGRA